MMKLTPSTIDGNSLNSVTFTSVFTGDSGLDTGLPYEALMSGASSGSPQYQGKIASPRTLVLRVTINARTMANAELLLKWFDISSGEHTLVVTAEGAEAKDTRYLLCTVASRKAVEGVDWVWDFILQAADGRWKYNEADNAVTISASPNSTSVVGNGDTRSVLKIRVKPTIVKAAADGWRFRRRIIIANRSPQALVCPNGAIGYPIDLFGAAWDHAALVAAGTPKSLASGADVRLFVDGAEWPRYASAWNSAATHLWSPLAFAPGRSCAITLTGASEATVASAETLNNVASFPASGYIVYGTGATPELIWYESHDDYHFYNIHRGMWGTTVSAWSNATTSWFVEHDIQVFYGYTGSSAAPIASTITDFTPIIDMVNSTNILHKFTNTFWNRLTRNSRQFVPSYKEVNDLDKNTSLADAAAPSFRDTPGLFKKNVLTLDCPVEVATSATALNHDITIATPNLAMLVKGLDTIGNDEITLATYYSGQSGVGANKDINVASPMSQISYEIHQLILAGANAADYAFSTITKTSFRAQTFTLEKDSTIEAISVRVKRPSGSDTLLVDLVKAYPESGTTPSYLDATTTYMAQATITPVGATAEWDTIDLTAAPIKLKAGLYGLLFRSAGTTGVQVAHSNGSVMSGGEGKVGTLGTATFTISADFDAWANTGGTGKDSVNDPATTEDNVTYSGTEISIVRIPLASLPTPSPMTTWNNPKLSYEVTTAGGTTLWVRPRAYTETGKTNHGQDDPDADSNATMYTKKTSGNAYPSGDANWLAVGVKTNSITEVNFATDLATAKANVNRFSLIFMVTSFSGTPSGKMASIQHATAQECRLLIDVNEEGTACFATNEGWDYGFRIYGSIDDVPQADVPKGDGSAATILNLDVNMTAAKAPLIYAIAEEASGVYLLYGFRIHNTTTSQYVDITLPMMIGDEIEIDCAEKTAKWISAGDSNAAGIASSCVIGESVTQALNFSDEDEWIRIDPGLATANTLVTTDVGIGTVVVTFTPTSLWS